MRASCRLLASVKTACMDPRPVLGRAACDYCWYFNICGHHHCLDLAVRGLGCEGTNKALNLVMLEDLLSFATATGWLPLVSTAGDAQSMQLDVRRRRRNGGRCRSQTSLVSHHSGQQATMNPRMTVRVARCVETLFRAPPRGRCIARRGVVIIFV